MHSFKTLNLPVMEKKKDSKRIDCFKALCPGVMWKSYGEAGSDFRILFPREELVVLLVYRAKEVLKCVHTEILLPN